MRFSRSGDRARTAVAVVLLLVIAGSSAMVVLPAGRPSIPTYTTPDGLADSGIRLDDPLDADLVVQKRRDERRTALALRQARRRDVSYLVPARVPTGSPTLVLVSRDEAYDLDAVAALAPDVFDRLDDGSVLVRHPVLLAPGATLVVDSATVPALWLASGRGGEANLTSVRSTLRFVGHAGRPLTVGSYDPATGGPDRQPDDGRAYVLARGGELWADHATFQDLGFAADSGSVSGVAWMATAGAAARGGASDTTFRRNWVGAYASGARGLRFSRVAFLGNTLYGFDPHTGTRDTLVEQAVAARNGRHGIIFSEGCLDNVVRDSEAYLNGGSGFVVDDGAVDTGLGRPSDRNVLVRVDAHDNGAAGVVVEGGADNVVEASTVANNEFGVWVRNEATGTVVRDNDVTASRWAAIRLDEGVDDTTVVHNDVAGGRAGITVGGGSASITENWVRGVTEALAVDGDGDGAEVEVRDLRVTQEGRGVTLEAVLHRGVALSWIVILLIPLVSCAGVAGGRLSRRDAVA